jgi:SP family facilitated glucose transporter-like MFS transporter 8
MSSLQPELLHLTNDGKYLETSTKRQFYAALIMSLLAFAYGSCCGWPSAAVLLLTSEDDTPLETGPINTNDVGWIASAVGIGGFIGNLFFGWVKFSI